MQTAEQTIQAFEADTMAQMITLIERLTQKPVYVGTIPGTDGKTIYACVDVEERQARIQCPGETEAEAVAALFGELFPE